MSNHRYQEAKQVWENALREYQTAVIDPHNKYFMNPHIIAIDVIAAARKRWQNEALEEAAKGPSDCKCNACQLWREHLRALKK